ncbi:chromosome transmission fidelity protein 8 [Apiospora kogelbergensis]|uniref:Chromosome transmission fidelity protein 8 n=1 Tax=Apiospora kogelbergensis TaxID=1337665 RepID=A0AAW0R9C5_9PEZI
MATSVQLFPRPAAAPDNADVAVANPLPPLIQTPSGLALLELQGTINLPHHDGAEDDNNNAPEIPIGRVQFPDYRPDALDPKSTAWMKRVHMYVGQHQRMTGEVKKLPRPMAVIRKRAAAAVTGGADTEMTDAASSKKESSTTSEDLEVVEIIKYKLVFSSRPEPVGSG